MIVVLPGGVGVSVSWRGLVSTRSLLFLTATNPCSFCVYVASLTPSTLLTQHHLGFCRLFLFFFFFQSARHFVIVFDLHLFFTVFFLHAGSFTPHDALRQGRETRRESQVEEAGTYVTDDEFHWSVSLSSLFSPAHPKPGGPSSYCKKDVHCCPSDR